MFLNKELSYQTDFYLRVLTRKNYTKCFPNRRQRLEATDSISSEDGMKGDLTSSKPQVKRSDEGAQLLLPAETKVADGIAGSGAVSNSGKKNIFHFTTINFKAF